MKHHPEWGPFESEAGGSFWQPFHYGSTCLFRGTQYKGRFGVALLLREPSRRISFLLSGFPSKPPNTGGTNSKQRQASHVTKTSQELGGMVDAQDLKPVDFQVLLGFCPSDGWKGDQSPETAICVAQFPRPVGLVLMTNEPLARPQGFEY